MTHIANQVFLFVGKYTRNSYVSGGLTNEHNMSVQSTSYLGIMVSVICLFFVSALQLLEIGCKINYFHDNNKKIRQKVNFARLARMVEK